LEEHGAITDYLAIPSGLTPVSRKYRLIINERALLGQELKVLILLVLELDECVTSRFTLEK
jgi:hypothetical protein